MERICFVFELKPGAEAEYERRHAEIWPEMTALMDEAGICDYSMFRRGTMIYAFLKADPDWATVVKKVADSEVRQRWVESMNDLIAWQLDENGNLQFAKEVFRHEGRPKAQ